MSELLRESTEQKLVVSSTEPASVADQEQANVGTSDENCSAKGQSDPLSRVGKSNANGDQASTGSTSPEAQSPVGKSAQNVAMPAEWNDDLATGAENAGDSVPAKSSFWSSCFAKKTPGEQRHQRVVSTCVLFSLAVLGLSTIDVGALCEQKMILDSHLKLTPISEAQKDLLATNKIEDPLSAENMRRVRSSSYSNMGYANNSGKIVVPVEYEETLEFTEGLGAVRPGKVFNGKSYESNIWVYVDQNGKTVLDNKYKDASPFHKGVAAVVIGDKGILIDKTGKEVASTGGDKLSERYGNTWECFADNGKVGLLDVNGKQVLEPIYDKIEPFVTSNMNDGYPSQIDDRQPNTANSRFFKITLNGVHGVVDANGKILVEPKYADIAGYNKGYATFKQGSKYGYVNGAGDVLVKPKYNFLTAYDTICAAKNEEGDWLALNGKGEKIPLDFAGPVVPMHHSWVREGRAPFLKDNHVGFLDRFGRIVIKPIYDFATPFHGGLSTVSMNGLWHFINKQGVMQNTPPLTTTQTMTPQGIEVSIPGPMHDMLDGRDIDQNKYNVENSRNTFANGLKGDDS